VTTTDAPTSLSSVLVSLMKGVTYRDFDLPLWQALLAYSARVREYVMVLGLELVLDEAEGYAYLTQRTPGEGEAELPRLVARRPLGYQVSLLLALLRKKLAELDARSGEARLVLGRDEIVDLLRVVLPDTANEARLFDRIDAHINKLVELGFLRRLRPKEDRFEVQRIVKAFVDAQWLVDFEERLARYREYAAGDGRNGAEEAS
jgi:hypothetical protein